MIIGPTFALFVRGLYWRRGFSIAVLLIGVICASVASIGPLYAHAVSESTLTDQLRQAGSSAGLAFSTQDFAHKPNAANDLQQRLGAAATAPGFGTPILGRSVLVTAKTAANQVTTISTMVWRDGECAHLIITAGRCPDRPGEALVPEATSTGGLGWQVDHSLTIFQDLITPAGNTDGPVIGQVTITGSYRPRDTADPYWFELPYFASELGPAQTSAIKGGADAIFVAQSEFLTAPAQVQTEVDVDVPLVPSRVRLADVPALKRSVASIEHEYPVTFGKPNTIQIQTGLPAALAAAARDHDAVTTATLVVILELAALSLLVLVQVVGGAVDARGNEIALAKLRGLPARKTVVFALAEPISLLLIAAPIGLALGYGVTVVLTHAALLPGTPVALTAATGWALVAAFTGSAVAAVLAGVRTVTRPVLEQWRTTSLRRHVTRGGLSVSIALALAAGVISAVLRIGSSSHPRPVLLIAPGLIVFAIALLGVQVLPRLGRLGLEPTRSSHKIATFLALRQTVRRPSGLRVAALFAVAAGLATFAICGEAVASSNRSARAETELGTARQVSVQYEPGHDPESIVDAVDPDGRWAMAAAAWVPDGGGNGQSSVTGTLLGIEASRVTATVYPVRGQLSPAALTAGISAAVGTPATFAATAVRVTLDLDFLVGNTASLDIDVRRGYGQPTTVPAGQLHLGTHTYTAEMDCRTGCTFTGVTFARPITAPITQVISGAATLTSVQTSTGGTFTALPVALDDLRAWRGGQDGSGATSTVARGNQGVSISFRSDVGSSAVLVHADYPSILPVVAAPKSLSRTTPTGSVRDYSNVVLPYRITRLASPLPAVLDAGAVADLAYLRLSLPNFDNESVWSVWLSPKAPADAVARLERAGILVQHTSSEAARVAELSRQGPALGLLLLLVCAIAAALLATGGCAVSIMADARRRSFELAALRVVGVGQKALRRSAIVEQGLLLGAAVVLGLPSGYLAAYLVLPVIPEFSDSTPVVLRFGPPIGLALACMAAFAVLLALTANVAGRMLVRAAVPVRLREAA